MPTSPSAKRDMAKHVTSPVTTERENPCLLFITASVAPLDLGPGGNSVRRPTTEENAFWNLHMAATSAVPTRAICYRDDTIRELNK